MIRFLVAIFALLAPAAQAETVRLAVTTSFENSGLSDVLLPAIAADTGIAVQLVVVGSGQALRLAEAGDVDAVIVHAPEAEAAFVAAGHATHRRPFMVNDFVIVGPEADPANLQNAGTASVAFTMIADTESMFVSRGDRSGTHQTEEKVWAAAGLDPESFGRWYASVGAGMGAALNTAAAMQAYILTDRGSWLNFDNAEGLSIQFEGDPMLENQYSFLPVNAARHPHVAAQAVGVLEEWLTSPAAERLINGYQMNGAQLFRFIAIAQ